MSAGLVFYEKSHRYKLDGQWVPGVTTLIKDGLPKSALMYWSARTVAEYVADNPEAVETLRSLGRNGMVAALKEIPWQKRDDAGARGTEVHALAQRLLAGEEVEVPGHLVDLVNACVDFLDDWQPKPLVVERPLAHRAHWWAGTADLFAELPDGRIALLDWKTAASDIYGDAAFQFVAYSRAEFYLGEDGQEHPVPKVDLCAAVHLRPHGYEVRPVIGDHDRIYKEFRHITVVAAAAKNAKGNKTRPGYIGDPMDTPQWKDTAAA